MKIKLLLITTFLAITSFSGYSQNGKPTKVGQEVNKIIESNHPYSGSKSENLELVLSQRVFEKDASYIAVHFEKFDLKRGDYLIIRNPDNTRSWKYSSDSESRKNFWSIHIYGEEAIIETYSKNKSGGYGYKIDKIAKGYQYPMTQINTSEEIVCGPDDSREAKCYQNSEPFIYDKSRAVARLLINGTNACTGWLIGDDGHLMTNEHCIENAATANNVTVEFMAEGSSCNTDCTSWFGCGGTIEATSTTLVKVNANLDYSLLKLPNNVSSQYGFLQLREAGAIQGERIYLPQHPMAWGKRIAVESTVPHDTGGFARVHSLNEPRCGGSGNDVGYYADTQGGSSGSPVLGYDDNLVVALHHCGACPNRGVPIQEIINNLGNDLPNNAIGNGATIEDIALLCYTNTETINLYNNQNNPVTWQVSSNVTIISSNNSSITVKAKYASSSGSGWVKATLSSGLLLQENFQVGKGEANNVIFRNTGAGALGYLCSSHYNNEFEILPNISNTSYEVRIRNLSNYNIVAGPYIFTGNIANLPTNYNYTPGWYLFETRIINSCGTSNWSQWEVEFVDCTLGGGGGESEYQVFPNPSSDLLTIQKIEPVQKGNPGITSHNISAPATFKIFDLNSNLIYSGSLEDQITIDVTTFEMGEYILKISRKNKSESHKIIVY